LLTIVHVFKPHLSCLYILKRPPKLPQLRLHVLRIHVKTVYAPCRRVLIQQNARGLLPGFMRWVRGVVDCEDVPLNISREVGAPVHVASP
jgi:hypothetical protein